MDDRAYLEQLLHQDIPLTQALGLGVLGWRDGELRLGLPLAANLNHKSSMFGGSLYCGGAGWLGLVAPEPARGWRDGWPYRHPAGADRLC